MVSHVSSLQQRGVPWTCVWCQARNGGYRSRNDPAAASLADLAADMASHGLGFRQRQDQVRDMQPVLIVTTNEIPGYQITRVHGDVFGLIVRARNIFSNIGAQFMTVAGPTAGTRPASACGSRHGPAEPTPWSRCALTATRSATSCPRSPPTAPQSPSPLTRPHPSQPHRTTARAH